MKRSAKLILLVLLLALIAIALFIVLLAALDDIAFLHEAMNIKLLTFSVLGCMSAVFQIKQLRLNEHQEIKEDGLLDSEIDKNTISQKRSRWMNSLLLCYFGLGIYVVVSSLMGFSFLSDYFPPQNLPQGIDRYAIVFFFFLFGIVLLIDAWKSAIVRPKQRMED